MITVFPTVNPAEYNHFIDWLLGAKFYASRENLLLWVWRVKRLHIPSGTYKTIMMLWERLRSPVSTVLKDRKGLEARDTKSCSLRPGSLPFTENLCGHWQLLFRPVTGPWYLWGWLPSPQESAIVLGLASRGLLSPCTAGVWGSRTLPPEPAPCALVSWPVGKEHRKRTVRDGRAITQLERWILKWPSEDTSLAFCSISSVFPKATQPASLMGNRETAWVTHPTDYSQ